MILTFAPKASLFGGDVKIGCLRMNILKLYNNGLVRNTVVYVLSDAINRAVPFLILPIIVRFLTPEDYGVITNYAVLVQIVTVFIFGASQGSIPVHFFKMEKEEFRIYVINIISIAFAISVLCVAVFLLFDNYLYEILGLSKMFLVLAVIEVMFSAFICVNMLIWRCEEQPTKFGAFQISQTILNVVFTLILVMLMKWAWEGKIIAGFLAAFLMGTLSILILYKKGYYHLKIDFSKARLVLIFALPLIPHALALWGKTGIDKIIITNISGLAENGLYSTAITWGAIITMVITSFGNAYNPYLLKKLAQFDKIPSVDNHYSEKTKIVKLSYIFVGIIGIIVLISYFFFYGLILYIYPESYHPSTRFLSWIMLGEFFRGWYLIYINYIHHVYKTKILGVITFSLSILQIGLSYVLLISVGTVGAAISTCIISLLTTIGVGTYACKVYPMPWWFKK